MIHYRDDRVTLHHGDALDVLRSLPDASVGSVVTDPPYGLEFMGKDWDRPWAQHFTGIGEGAPLPDRQLHVNPRCKGCGGYRRGTKKPCRCAAPDWTDTQAAAVGRTNRAFQQWCEQWAAECLRVLKPGGHLLAFGGTRTWHRLACAVEDAGFEVRDSVAWLYGSGFPKSLDVSKAIDKRRDWTLVARLSGEIRRARSESGLSLAEIGQATLDATGGIYGKWYHRGGHMFFETGRNLPSRPEWEQLRHVLPIRPEFVEVYDEAEREVIQERRVTDRRNDGTVVGLGHTGNVDVTAPATDAAREWAGWGTALKPAFEPVVVARKPLTGTVAHNVTAHGTGALNIDGCRIGTATGLQRPERRGKGDTGGWADYSQEPGQYGTPDGQGRWPANVVLDEDMAGVLDEQSGTLTSGANPTRRGSDKFRDAYGEFRGQEECTPARGVDTGGASRFYYVAKAPKRERPVVDGVAHPTVKPLALMRWLVRLVTPPGGTVLEPFAGSGTTVEACILEGFHCIAIEKGEEYLPLILERIRRQTEPVEPVRRVDPARAIAEQVAEQLDIFGEETA